MDPELRHRSQSAQKLLHQFSPQFDPLLVARCNARTCGWGHADMTCKASAFDEADGLEGLVRGGVLATTHILRDKLLIAITASFL